MLWLVLLLSCSTPAPLAPVEPAKDAGVGNEVIDSSLLDVPPPDDGTTASGDTVPTLDSDIPSDKDTTVDSVDTMDSITDIRDTGSPLPTDSSGSTETHLPPRDVTVDMEEEVETLEDTGLSNDPVDRETSPPTDTNETVETDTAPEWCLPDPPEEGSPNEFPISLGKKLGPNFVPLETGDPIEIVQGPQGGVHLEIMFKITLPESFSESKVLVLIDAKTFQPCCSAEQSVVGSFYSAKYPLYPKPDDAQTFYSDVIPVIFEQNLAMYYQDQDCCVRFQVSAYEPGTQTVLWTGWTEDSLLCTDYF